MDSQRAKNREVVLAIYDLQAVLPVPMGDPSSFFYKSRLNCYNFTITDTGKDRTRCYFWHEGLGHRGVTEIGTAIFMFLEDLATSNPGANVVFYSDNCGGQQKNRYFIGMYMYAVEYLNINSITHKYLVRGHTQNQGDCVHSIIERSMKKAKRSGPIYVPDQIVSVIRSAKKTGNPLEVREMSTEDFYDLKALYDAIALNISKNVIGDDFKISEVRLIQFEKGSNIFKYKTSYKQLEWSYMDTQPKTRRSLNAKKLKDINLQRAYEGNIVLPPDKKKKDLKDLIDGNKIPRFYKYFYDSLGC